MDISQLESELNLAVLFEIARTVPEQEAVAEAICAHAVAALGLAGASIALVRRDAGEPRLELTAAIGQHSQFIRDMITPMDKVTGATSAALRGEPIFEGNPHGVEEDAERLAGVARWRDGFGVHAYAILALTVLEGTIGVLNLEWPEPHAFTDADRESLLLFADAVALVMRPLAPCDESQRDTTPSRPSCDDADAAALHVSASGLIVPAAAGASWAGPPFARVWTAVTSNESTGESAAFADVLSAPHGGVVLVTGTALAAGSNQGLVEAVATGRSVVSSASSNGSSPGDILGMLGGAIRANAAGSAVSATVAALQPSTGGVEIAEAGAVAVITRRSDGRFALVQRDSPPVSAGWMPRPSRAQLVLPGDRIAILAGGVSSFSDLARIADAEFALADLADVGGERTARTLLSFVCGNDLGAAAMVIEVVGE